MLFHVRSPVSHCLFWCLTQLLIEWSRTFTQRDNFPLLRLAWKLDRSNWRVQRLRWSRSGFGLKGIFGRVHNFLRFVLKEPFCSLHLAPAESRTAPDETHPASGGRAGRGAPG